MKKLIVGAIIRHIAGWLGVAGVVGLEDDFQRIMAAGGALATLLWSLYQKVKLART